MVFAVLGAATFVILDFYSKLRDSLLGPQDHSLSWIRLMLGSVVGACIGFFFISHGPQAAGVQADVIGALTLTASGIGFSRDFASSACSPCWRRSSSASSAGRRSRGRSEPG